MKKEKNYLNDESELDNIVTITLGKLPDMLEYCRLWIHRVRYL